MKRILLGLMAMVAVSAFAATQQQVIGDYTWSYSTYAYNTKAEIISVRPKTGDIIVPSELGGLPVEQIGSGAFEGGIGISSNWLCS